MDAQAQRMTNLVNDLLLLSRLENDSVHQEHRSVNVPALLGQLRNEAIAYGLEKHQDITLECDERVRLLESDGLSGLHRRFDLIVCNPPYVNAQSMAALPAEYRAEPELALAGGTDGMDFIRQLLADAPRCLTPEGVLVLEIGNEREHFERAFPNLNAVWLPVSAGDDQVLLLTREALTA